jgi:hypothetical protein
MMSFIAFLLAISDFFKNHRFFHKWWQVVRTQKCCQEILKGMKGWIFEGVDKSPARGPCFGTSYLGSEFVNNVIIMMLGKVGQPYREKYHVL